MYLDSFDRKKISRERLYPYQRELIEKISNRLNVVPPNYNILFQLPTGGGKTVIFSEIARNFIEKHNKKVLILTHRIELSRQTSKVLSDSGVPNKIINSEVRELDDQHQYKCFTAMVETLNNRLSEYEDYLTNIGLVVVDEAHYNSFRKIFQYFENVNILGVTATPLSSNKKLPLKDNYKELIVGDSIPSLISSGYLSEATTYCYDVNLRSLKVGVNGDFTASSSYRLYSNYHMQDKLIQTYEEAAKGTKTLIFNNGIATSKMVCELFQSHGYDIKHLDNTFGKKERKDVLDWFRDKPDAILTSVSILTTGFDEPTVGTIVLNRATRSLTLYHQMIGRGSRVTKEGKKTFNIIDLGHNSKRFGLWQEYIDWQKVFANPEIYLEDNYNDYLEELEDSYEPSPELLSRIANYTKEPFSVRATYDHCVVTGKKANSVIEKSIENHFNLIVANSDSIDDSLQLVGLFQEEIIHRIKEYATCLSKATDNYRTWLLDSYNRKLKQKLRSRVMV